MAISSGSFQFWSPGPLVQWLGHHLNLVDSVGLNAEWLRSEESTLQLVQDFSDFFDSLETQTLALVEQIASSVTRPGITADTLTFAQSVTVSGGQVLSPGIEPITATFQSTALKGMALYVPSNGAVDLARADTHPFVVGLAKEDTSSGNGEYLTEGQITQTDWSQVAGTVSLSPGVYYYLSTATGQITSLAPTTPGQFVVVVGRALTTTTFDIEIHPPILL